MPNQTMPSTQPSQDHKRATPRAPLVEVTRTFDAPIECVWRAFSDAEQIKQWWGPEHFSCPSAKTEFKVGGRYLFAMKAPDGSVNWSTGSYEEIDPLEKIAYSDDFSDEKGNVISASEAGLPGDWFGTTYVTLEFEKTDEDSTKFKLTHENIPASMHDDCVSGWSTSIDKVQKLVERS